MKNKYILILPVLLLLISVSAFFKVKSVHSLPVQTMSDSLSTSQYSYYGGLPSGNTPGNSYIRLDLTNSFPSRDANNLFIGDTLAIGVGGSQNFYIVKDIGSTAIVDLNIGVSSINTVAGSTVIATRSAIHTVTFTPTMTAAGGFWQFLIKIANNGIGESYGDGIPDQTGFDTQRIGSTAAIACPPGATASIGATATYTLGSPAVTSSYQIYQCNLGNGLTNAIGTGISMVIGTGNSALINPSPSSGNTEGIASVFTYILRQGDSGGLIVDSTVGKIAVVEAVRITATVDPTLSFSIDNNGATSVGSSACGVGVSLSSGAVNTTGDQVIFGSLAIGTTANKLAQRLTVTTNGVNGYVVTAYEGNPMINIGYTSSPGVAYTLPDTICDSGPCTNSGGGGTWSIGTTSGFGYSIYTVSSVGNTSFSNGDGTKFRPFGNGSANAKNILQYSTFTNGQSAYVCYQIVANAAQPVGDYEGKVIYTATATF